MNPTIGFMNLISNNIYTRLEESFSRTVNELFEIDQVLFVVHSIYEVSFQNLIHSLNNIQSPRTNTFVSDDNRIGTYAVLLIMVGCKLFDDIHILVSEKNIQSSE